MKASVLLIDDDYSTNLYHEIILSESNRIEGIEICESSDDAISFLKEQEHFPDLILLDINMPIKSGWTFLEDFRMLFSEKVNSVVVILSTTRMEEDVQRARQHPIVDHFETKPLTIEKVDRFLQQ